MEVAQLNKKLKIKRNVTKCNFMIMLTTQKLKIKINNDHVFYIHLASFYFDLAKGCLSLESCCSVNLQVYEIISVFRIENAK